MSDENLISVDYEIFGRVQGVFFRKYTQAEGKKLGLVGWVQNTGAGTVQGQLQGPHSKVKEMQEWLKSTGSPKSHITKAEFKNEKTGTFANKPESSRHPAEHTGNGMILKSAATVFISLHKDGLKESEGSMMND